MEFVKKHYEKIVLSVVLLGLVGAVAWLPIQIDRERATLKERRESITGKPKKYVPLNLAAYDASLARMTNVTLLNFSGAHNLFNPVVWQIGQDGRRIKISTGKEVGAEALVITGVSNLYFTVTLDKVQGPSYTIGFVREAAARQADRTKKVRYVSASNKKNEFFEMKEVKGPAENPTEIVLEWLGENKELISVSKDKPFQRVEGYTVDMKYAPENLVFTGRRVNDVISFGGDDYNIVDIAPTGIVLLSKSSTRRLSIKFNAAP